MQCEHSATIEHMLIAKIKHSIYCDRNFIEFRQGQCVVDECIWRWLRLRQCDALFGKCVLQKRSANDRSQGN